MPQPTLPEYLDTIERANLLTRIKEEKRVDELPMLMEQYPDRAVLVEKVKDSPFPFLAGAYGVRKMFAMSLGCKEHELGAEIVRRLDHRFPPKVTTSSVCKDVIIKGDDVDLTAFPLFCHHDRDGQAFLNDCNIVTRDPDTGVNSLGIYRLMFRTKNTTSINMENVNHLTRIHADKYGKRGTEVPIACLIGGPAIPKLSQMEHIPDVDDYDILGGLYGEPVELIKCETNDLMVPANSEIVLEGRLMISEGFVHDEGAYGEYTGTYGGGLPSDCRIIWDCITHRKDAIFQLASIGGMHPGRTDMLVVQPAIEADIYGALARAGIDVVDVYCPPAACANIAYARIRPRGGGDANNALALMLTASRQWVPKIAYVFDEDVDIYDPDRVQWAFTFRYNPETGTTLLPRQNANALDPSLTTSKPPFHVTKVGFDCTIPLEHKDRRWTYDVALMTPPLEIPADTTALSEEEVAKRMEAFIREAPRSWHDIVKQFAGQSYRVVYRAFGQLRPRLGRLADEAPYFPYVLSDEEVIHGKTAADWSKGHSQKPA